MIQLLLLIVDNLAALFSRLSPTGFRNDLAASLYPGLRSASASSDAGKCAPDSNLETGTTSWGRPRA